MIHSLYNLSTSRTIGLSIYRVILSFLVMKNMIFFFPMANSLFGPHAIFPYEDYVKLMDNSHLDYITYPFISPELTQVFVVFVFITACCFLFGIFKRMAGIILFLLLLIMKLRNGFILDGSDNVIEVTLPFLILSDSFDYFTYPIGWIKIKWNEKIKPILQSIKSIATAGLLIQVAFVYFFTALAKLQGKLWLNGTAVYYTMRVDEFRASSWNISLTENHYFVVFSTYFTLIWELAFPFLVWFAPTRLWILLGGILLHTGIFIFMRIDNFSWIMIATYFIFIPNTDYQRFFAWLTKQRLTLWYDNWCPNCIRFKKTIETIDIFKNVNFIELRNIQLPEYIDIERSKKQMASAKKNSNGIIVYYGFNTLYHLTLAIPLLLFFYPIMAILKLTSVGNKVYDELAIKRQIIPLHCTDNCNI